MYRSLVKFNSANVPAATHYRSVRSAVVSPLGCSGDGLLTSRATCFQALFQVIAEEDAYVAIMHLPGDIYRSSLLPSVNEAPKGITGTKIHVLSLNN